MWNIMIVRPTVYLWGRTWLTRLALLMAGFGILLFALAMTITPFVSGDEREVYRMIPMELLLSSECVLVLSVVLMHIARALGHAK